MTTDKHIAYKIWLDELNTIPSQDFFPTLRQILELLEKENPSKINKLTDIVDKETIRFANRGNKAVQELEPLLQEIESTIKDEKAHIPSKIQEYKDIKVGKIQIIGEDLPDTLYHAIRLSLEDYRNSNLTEKFTQLMSAGDGLTYLDYEKMCQTYPEYKQFKEYKEMHDRRSREEPWGALVYLRWALDFFQNVLPEQAGSFVKTDIISNTRRLILYLLTPEVEKLEAKTKEAKNYTSFTFNDETITLVINGKQVKFTRDTRKLTMLKLLIKKPKGVYFSEIVKDLEGADADKSINTKNIYYETCRGIVMSLARVGVTDFLLFDFNQAKINPTYKRVSK